MMRSAILAIALAACAVDPQVDNTSAQLAAPHRICPSARCSPIAGCSIGVIGANTPPSGGTMLSNGVYWIACDVRSQAQADSVCSNGCGGGSTCVDFDVNDAAQFMLASWDEIVDDNPGISSFDLVNDLNGRMLSWTLGCLNSGGVIQARPDFPASHVE